ncbi:hypothetical protein BDF22DRAFT_663963 [Syncephalis plumigaleata]|nr:hypothetical protein BDF22DRAFT_663963 [Syncephalis plumigaleata]
MDNVKLAGIIKLLLLVVFLLLASVYTARASIAGSGVRNDSTDTYADVKLIPFDGAESLAAYVSQPPDHLPVRNVEGALADLKELAFKESFRKRQDNSADTIAAAWIAQQVTATSKLKGDSLAEFRILNVWISEYNTQFNRHDTVAEKMLTIFLVDVVELGNQGESAAPKILEDYATLVKLMRSVGVEPSFTSKQYLDHCYAPVDQ